MLSWRVMLHQILDFVLHVDTHLAAIIVQYGSLTYGILAFIVFAETGFVLTPFLPGDSLLFAAGALAAKGDLSLGALFFLLSVAAILGNSVNYGIGRMVGPAVYQANWRLLNREGLAKTHAFYERYGGLTILVTRFMPIFRTFAPFVAGVGEMPFARFTFFNALGGVAWVGLFVFGGALFGTIPAVEKHFSLVILGIIAVSLLPLVISGLRRMHGTMNQKR